MQFSSILLFTSLILKSLQAECFYRQHPDKETLLVFQANPYDFTEKVIIDNRLTCVIKDGGEIVLKCLKFNVLNVSETESIYIIVVSSNFEKVALYLKLKDHPLTYFRTYKFKERMVCVEQDAILFGGKTESGYCFTTKIQESDSVAFFALVDGVYYFNTADSPVTTSLTDLELHFTIRKEFFAGIYRLSIVILQNKLQEPTEYVFLKKHFEELVEKNGNELSE